nr:hypothetical protein [Tanacetum cinerariifolium]
MSSFPTFSISYVTLLTFCISISLISTHSTASPPRPFKKVYVFGDSYSDTGNNNNSHGPIIWRHVSDLPYGRTFFHHATNRYSDGRLVIDFVAEYLNLPYIPPYANKSADTTHGVNFALEWFKDHIKGSGCKDAASTPKQCKAVFDATSKTIQEQAIWYEIKLIKELLKMGAKYVVVQGLPTTGCFPVAFTLEDFPKERDDIGCVAAKNKQSYDHNIVLQAKLHSLRMKFPSTVIVYGDDWHAYHKVYKNSRKYGFTERLKACCGSGGDPHNFNLTNTCGSPGAISCKHPSRYMSWDGLHVTEALNSVLAKLFIEGPFAQPPFSYLLKKAAE